MAKVKDDWLQEARRAEDIILGSIGLGEEAKLKTIEITSEGFSGEAVFADGEVYSFDSEDELTELDQWALTVLTKSNSK